MKIANVSGVREKQMEPNAVYRIESCQSGRKMYEIVSVVDSEE